MNVSPGEGTAITATPISAASGVAGRDRLTRPARNWAATTTDDEGNFVAGTVEHRATTAWWSTPATAMPPSITVRAAELAGGPCAPRRRGGQSRSRRTQHRDRRGDDSGIARLLAEVQPLRQEIRENEARFGSRRAGRHRVDPRTVGVAFYVVGVKRTRRISFPAVAAAIGTTSWGCRAKKERVLMPWIGESRRTCYRERPCWSRHCTITPHLHAPGRTARRLYLSRVDPRARILAARDRVRWRSPSRTASTPLASALAAVLALVLAATARRASRDCAAAAAAGSPAAGWFCCCLGPCRRGRVRQDAGLLFGGADVWRPSSP